MNSERIVVLSNNTTTRGLVGTDKQTPMGLWLHETGMRLRRALVTGHFDRNKCMLICRTAH